MRFTGIPADTRVLPGGRRIELPGGPDAVLILHGWTAWPGRMAHLARRLNEAGHAVVVPRLPGHGTNVRDILQTRAEDWVRRATDEYLDLAARHERVFLTGTSMGAMIAAMIAAKFDVERVALLAPAFLNRNKLIVLTPFLNRLVPRIRGDWREEQEVNPESVEIAREYATYNYTLMASELLKVQRSARRLLPQLRSQTLVVVSLSDMTVPSKVAEFIERRSNAARFEKIVVERSNHQLAENVDRDAVADAVVRWFAPR